MNEEIEPENEPAEEPRASFDWRTAELDEHAAAREALAAAEAERDELAGLLDEARTDQAAAFANYDGHDLSAKALASVEKTTTRVRALEGKLVQLTAAADTARAELAKHAENNGMFKALAAAEGFGVDGFFGAHGDRVARIAALVSQAREELDAVLAEDMDAFHVDGAERLAVVQAYAQSQRDGVMASRPKVEPELSWPDFLEMKRTWFGSAPSDFTAFSWTDYEARKRQEAEAKAARELEHRLAAAVAFMPRPKVATRTSVLEAVLEKHPELKGIAR